MTFLCPGCHRTHPIGDGQLVYEATSAEPARKARLSVGAYPERRGEILIAVLCAPCTADLVLARAGVSR